MTIRKIEELDFYELLNLRFDASPEEVETAYLRAIVTYHEEALASYGVLSAEERDIMLERIEAAFQTLGDPARKKAYDAALLPSRPEYGKKAYFRKSTARLEIEDASEKRSVWGKIQSLLFPKLRNNIQKIHGLSRVQESERKVAEDYYTGQCFKVIREKRGLSRAEIAATLGLREEILKAIEEENYAALPRRKDLSSILRLYARSLGLHAGSKH